MTMPSFMLQTFDSLGLLRKKKRVVYEQNFACNKCKNTHWMGLPITLELEHIDGDRHNHSRENLECLCPNCHSQTKTWRGRNNTTNTVSDAEFVEAIKSTPNVGQALLKLRLAGAKNYRRAYRLKERYFLS